MNDKFFELPEQKQLNIINAGMEVFGKNDYKKAVTDDIAAKAGISKGLLFYYFHNKKSFYLYIYKYCIDLLKQMTVDIAFYNITDFFELIEYGANKKMDILTRYPYVNEFVVRAFYSQGEGVSEQLQKSTRNSIDETYDLYFSKMDTSKFKVGVDPKELYKMLVWMTDGYLHEKQSEGVKLDLDEVMEEYHKWKKMFRNMAYKEEWL